MSALVAVRVKSLRSYIKPTKNTRLKPSLFRRLSCSLQMTGNGKTKSAKPMATENAPSTTVEARGVAHRTLMVVSQCAPALGVQKIAVMTTFDPSKANMQTNSPYEVNRSHRMFPKILI